MELACIRSLNIEFIHIRFMYKATKSNIKNDLSVELF